MVALTIFESVHLIVAYATEVAELHKTLFTLFNSLFTGKIARKFKVPM